MASFFRVVFTLILLAASTARAESPLTVNIWARASIAGVPNAAVYGSFSNPGKQAIAIVGVSSQVAKSAMIHKTETKDGMVSMVPMKSLSVGPGQSRVCKPGKCHIMLMGLKRPLKPGDQFKLTLKLSSGRSQVVDVKVGGIAQMTAP